MTTGVYSIVMNKSILPGGRRSLFTQCVPVNGISEKRNYNQTSINWQSGYTAGHADVLLLVFHSLFSFFRRLISLGRSPPNFVTCSSVTQIYKCVCHTSLESVRKKTGGLKTSKFRRDFGQLPTSRLDREYIGIGTQS